MSGNSEAEQKQDESQGAIRTRTGDENYVLVYSLQQKAATNFPKQELSALIVTETGVVYGAGVNGLCIGSDTDTIPMIYDGGKYLTEYTKVDSLSGRGIKKVVVGKGFGGAIDSSNELLVWRFIKPEIPSGLVMFDCSPSDIVCRYCPPSCDRTCINQSVGGLSLKRCGNCYRYQVCNRPGRGVNVKKLVACKSPIFPCYKCFKLCESKLLNDTHFQYCRYCDVFLEKEKIPLALSENNLIYKMPRPNDERVTDITCSGNLLCSLLENNKLVLHHLESNAVYVEPASTEEKPRFGKRVALYGGGNDTLMVKTEGGKLLKCTTTAAEGSAFQLTEIQLPAAVDKCCCGSNAAAALLVDGSVWFITPDGIFRMHHNLGVCTFADIAVVAMSDLFLVQTSEQMEGSASVLNLRFTPSSLEIQVRFFHEMLASALMQMVCSNPVKQPQPTRNLADFFGKPYLSDMVIKLAEEEIPAHSIVLLSSSVHFRNTYSADKPFPQVLDMSHHNQNAYRYLLQYFYQKTPDDLKAEDLLDLRQLASSYGEAALADNAAAQIMDKVNEENVLAIFSRAKQLSFEDVVNKCEKIMLCPTFMKQFFSTHSFRLADLGTAESTANAEPIGQEKTEKL